MNNEIQPLKLCNYNVSRTLPLAFDESLSYLEELSGILYKLNETIVQVNYNTKVASEYDTYLKEIRAEVTRLENEYNQFKIDIENEIDNKFMDLTSQIYSYIQTQFDLIRYNLETQLIAINQKIDDIVAGDIQVHDPTTGLVEPIQVVINNLYDMNRTNAITATEFDGIELTATEFDGIEITAFNFDTNGKDLLNLNS